MGKCAIIELTKKPIFRTPIKERMFYNESKKKSVEKNRGNAGTV